LFGFEPGGTVSSAQVVKNGASHGDGFLGSKGKKIKESSLRIIDLSAELSLLVIRCTNDQISFLSFYN